jgi:hypothetical protein
MHSIQTEQIKSLKITFTKRKITSTFIKLSRKKVAGSIPDGVTKIFQRINPSGRTKTPGSTPPLKKVGIRNISWG